MPAIMISIAREQIMTLLTLTSAQTMMHRWGKGARALKNELFSRLNETILIFRPKVKLCDQDYDKLGTILYVVRLDREREREVERR